MKFLQVFDYYFLAMMIFACFLLYFFESKGFKQQGDEKAFDLGRKVAIIMAALSVIAFVAARFL